MSDQTVSQQELRRLRSIGVPDYLADARTGRIEWCADWAHLQDCIRAGLVNARRVSGGPGTYGHDDWFVAVTR